MTARHGFADGCPACQAPGLRSFYALAGVPSHSVLLMETRQQAIEYPRGDIELGFCESCGFITNRRFDTSLCAYSQQCEESQHFSETFDRFAQALVRDLVNRFHIRNKMVLEIGCGKGDFLALLCQLGDNHGIGIDPACRPERVAVQAKSRIRWFSEVYGAQHAQYKADLICCRHTLEHIEPVDDFLRQVRQYHVGTPETLLLIEVPDTLRVLRELAFWDIYYEHCSYFTMDSLRRLVARHGFQVIDTQLAYGDQYLLLMARPSGNELKTAPPAHDDLAATDASVSSFQDRISAEINVWRDRVTKLHHTGRNPVLWGGGSKAVAFLSTTGLDREIACAVDINPHKQGKFLPGTGHQVVSPESLRSFQTSAIIVMNPIYCDEIQTTLQAWGIDAELILLR